MINMNLSLMIVLMEMADTLYSEFIESDVTCIDYYYYYYYYYYFFFRYIDGVMFRRLNAVEPATDIFSLAEDELETNFALDVKVSIRILLF